MPTRYKCLTGNWHDVRVQCHCAQLEAVDAVCRRLMIEAASDQSSVRAVGAALDKVRREIREQINATLPNNS